MARLWAIFDFAGSSNERKDQIKRTDVGPTEMRIKISLQQPNCAR